MWAPFDERTDLHPRTRARGEEPPLLLEPCASPPCLAMGSVRPGLRRMDGVPGPCIHGSRTRSVQKPGLQSPGGRTVTQSLWQAVHSQCGLPSSVLTTRQRWRRLRRHMSGGRVVVPVLPTMAGSPLRRARVPRVGKNPHGVGRLSTSAQHLQVCAELFSPSLPGCARRQCLARQPHARPRLTRRPLLRGRTDIGAAGHDCPGVGLGLGENPRRVGGR